MPEQDIKIAINESFNGEDVIPNLIETARNLLDTDIDQSQDFFEKALIISKNNYFQSGVGECLLELGKIRLSKGNLTGAYKLIQQAIDALSKTKHIELLYDCHGRLYDISYQAGHYEQSLEACLEALKLSKQLPSVSPPSELYNKIGKIYKALGDIEKAIEYHQHSLELFHQSNQKTGISETCYFLGECYIKTGNFDKALEFLEISLAIADELKNAALQVRPTGSLAVLFTKLKQPERATDFLYRAIDYVNITGDLRLKANLLRDLGELLIESGQYEPAIMTLMESLEIGNSINSPDPVYKIHKSLAKVFEKTGDFEKALEHFKKYNFLSSELQNEQVALKSKGIQLKYDFDEANKEKELADKAILIKDRFIANISHEIRTPLNGVLGMADLLADTKPSPEQLDYINTIRLSANNLINLVNDILDFSKMQSGEIRFENSEFKIKYLVTDIAQQLKPFAEEKRISTTFKVDDQIPEIIVGDQLRVKQVLVNILSNAIKFTDKGSIKLDVQLTQAKETDIKILFNITDTGIGISDEKIDTIFESFAHLGSDITKTSGGAGLGLAIVKQLVDLQGGNISVNSKLGTGTVFKVELPFKLTKPFRSQSGPVKSAGSIIQKDLSEIVILLVEDNKVNQFLAQKLLTKMGFGVVIANDGNEAIKLLKEQKFNLILMDVQMPEMNGYDLTEIIRHTLPSSVNTIPIIALTAYASTQEKEKALALGMSDYITKPYSPHELLTSIMKFVGPSGDESKGSSVDQESETFNPGRIKETTDKLLQLFSGSVNDVVSLLHMLINQIPLLLDEAETHIKNENWHGLFQSVHKLKSSVNLLKIAALADMVSEIEELSRDHLHTNRIPGIFARLKKSCEKAVDLLKEEIIRLKKSDQPK